MIVKLVSGLLDGLSGGQTIVAKLIGTGVLVGAVYLAFNAFSDHKFQQGFDSRNAYVQEIEELYAKAETERLRLDPLLETCMLTNAGQASKIDALQTQNSNAAEKANELLLETQRVNARALTAAAQKNNENADFYAALEERLKGLKNVCDENGNGVVIGGADILRSIQQKQ